MAKSNMSYNTTSLLLSSAELDHRVAQLIDQAGITGATNGFFTRARSTGTIFPSQALSIAYNWREITKAFLFNTIKGIGVMGEQAAREQKPSENLLRTIQTLFTVIGDDLNNCMPTFKEAAPEGLRGIHYIWWEDSVINPILRHCDPEDIAATLTFPGTKSLIASMEHLSQSCIGTAVQLRVVEAIALEIAIAFRRIFTRVESEGKPVFPHHSSLAWMDAHIKAEVTHSKQVSDHDYGMTGIADTIAKQQELIEQTTEHVSKWSLALKDFESILIRSPSHTHGKPQTLNQQH